jgi:hypothetical protein
MTAKNDITGDTIKSRSLSAKGRENWDGIFPRKTGREWMLEIHPEFTIMSEHDWLSKHLSRSEFFDKIKSSFKDKVNIVWSDGYNF